MEIGNDRASGSRFLDGWIGEVILFPSNLSAGDRTTLYTNQKAYWGTP
jgi:hypothetical protein